MAQRTEYFSRCRVFASPSMQLIAGAKLGGRTQGVHARGGTQYLVEGGSAHVPSQAAVVFAASLGREFVVHRSFPFVGLMAQKPRHGASEEEEVLLTATEYVETQQRVQRWLDDCEQSDDPHRKYSEGLDKILLSTGSIVSARTTPVDLVISHIPSGSQAPGWYSLSEASSLLSRTDPIEVRAQQIEAVPDEVGLSDVLFPGRRSAADEARSPVIVGSRAEGTDGGSAWGGGASVRMQSVTTATARPARALILPPALDTTAGASCRPISTSTSARHESTAASVHGWPSSPAGTDQEHESVGPSGLRNQVPSSPMQRVDS